ncbi:MAG: hypothetical protein H0T76_14705 [Nannocystis sp.]|nr:hypothetical protein [Nannocystis sp.]MBA3547731.1 hypothetical protein [Nannocystis sp.]
MMRRLLVALLLCTAPLACGGGKNLQKLEAPASGVTLAYDLSPGQVYKGSVSNSESVRATSGASLSRGFDFDVTLAVRGPDPKGQGTMVTARYSNVNIRWGLPPGATFSVGELVSKATSQLQGLEVDFVVDETGKVQSMPELPSDMPEELRFVLQEAIDTLETAFLPVPARPLKVGDSWKDDKVRGRKGKLGRYLEASTTSTVEGFFRDETKQSDVTKLKIEETETEITTAKTGSHEVKKQTATTALFAHADRYLSSLERTRQTFDPGNATIFTTLKVQWTKSPPPQGSAAAIKQVQDITDPCHPDYVGGEECQPAGAADPGDAAAPTQPGPAGDPVPVTPPKS